MPFDSATSQGIARFAAYVCTDAGAALARSVVQHGGGDSKAVHGGGLSGAARLCADVPLALTVLAEIGNIPLDLACECVREICRTGAKLVVLGEHDDLETYRALRKAGATEYFPLPAQAEDILAVQRDAPERPVVVKMPMPVQKSPSIAVMGSNGGVGASLLAQNLAFHGAAPKGASLRMALLDADLQFGSQAIDLDRDETGGLYEALVAPDRIDATFISATMDHLTENLSLYSHQIRAGQDTQSLERGLPRIFPPLRAEFDTIITDLPRGTLFQHATLAAQLDALVLVIPAGFAGVNAASQLIDRIAADSPDLRILPVLSGLRRDAGLSRKDIETTIGRPIVATLPRCDAQIARAHRAARPLIECQPRSAYAKAVAAIWAASQPTANRDDAPAKRSLIKRLFG